MSLYDVKAAEQHQHYRLFMWAFEQTFTKTDALSDDYRKLMKSMILEVKELVEGKKDYYSVSRDNYNVIVYLSRQNAEYFKGINKVNKKVLQEVYKMMEHEDAINCFKSYFS